MSQPITFNQIKAEVAALRRKKPIERTVGIRTPGRWIGEQLQRDGDTTYAITQCDSPLSLRIALKKPLSTAGEPVVQVVVTNLADGSISPDMFVRLHKQRLFSIDRWSLVQQQFAAESIDPRLVEHDWLADAVVEYLGGRQTTAAKSGFLDAETLWQELLTTMIGLYDELPDLAALFKWSLDGAKVRKLRELPEHIRKGTEDWLRERAGDAADFIFAVADRTDKPDAVPLALAVGVLVDEEARGKADRSIGKLEGGWLRSRRFTVEALGRAAGEAAALIRSHVADPAEHGRIAARAEELLQEVDGTDFAHRSPILPLGYAQRLGDFAEAMQKFCLDATSNLSAVMKAASRVRGHDQAHLNPADRDRLDMAMRLARWLQAERALTSQPESLADAAVDYLSSGSYVDWARTLVGGVAASRELSAAVDAIHAAATKEQERRARIFSGLLGNSVSAGVYSTNVLLVEQILEAVVVPLARTMPVLVVVLDGMSAAVCRELTDELTRKKCEWSAIVEQGRTSLRPALATIPSETKYSRASLLAGRLTANSPNETTAFETHEGLVAVSSPRHTPVLYTKSDLSGNTLSTIVREDIASPKRQVIGVIVNAVDDHLAKANQVEVRWTLDTLGILAALLSEARCAGRAVVLTSDHGHILEKSTVARVSEGGERWRPAGQMTPEGDEILMRGTRVLEPSGQILTSWSERVRYIAATKRGYHGGVNPQEMIVPISVLIPAGASEPDGWELAAEMSPLWWDEVASPTPKPMPPSASAKTATPPVGMLFDKNRSDILAHPLPVSTLVTSGTGDDAATVPIWAEQLFATQIFAEQKKLVPRGYPGDDVLKRLLSQLDSRGGKLTSPALARSLAYAPFRLIGLLSMAQRILNVDGYPVISVDTQSDTVHFQKQLLLVQFSLNPDGASR